MFDRFVTTLGHIMQLAILTFLTSLAFLAIIATYNSGARAVAIFLGCFLFVVLTILSSRVFPRRK